MNESNIDESSVAMDTRAISAKPSGLVLSAVAAHIEPVTRFGAQDLMQVSTEEVYGVRIEIAVNQTVSFNESIQRGPGRLAPLVHKLADERAFKEALAKRLADAGTEAPQALQAWADAKELEGSYRRLMPSRAAFLRSPDNVGYEHTCRECSGARQVGCPQCAGAGKLSCLNCTGRGKVNCRSCHGTTRQTCAKCHGQGYVTEQIWSGSSNGYIHKQRSCSDCSAGKTICRDCDYEGKITCGVCCGSGQLLCRNCHATGRINCPDCQAVGVQHVVGFVNATVSVDEVLYVDTSDEALRKLVESKVPREDMPQLGALIAVKYSVRGRAITTRHLLRLDVQRACLRASNADFVLYGFGPDTRVFNFENIAGHMLNDDLIALETCISASSKWRRHKGNDLLNTMAEFLRSELNMLIAERLSDAKASPAEAAAVVQGHFKDLVDEAYVARATRALRTGLARLYGSELTEPAFYLCGLVAIAAGVMHWTNWPTQNVWGLVMLILGGGALAWCGLEWSTLRRITDRFEGDFGRRVLDQLKIHGSIKRWRIGMSIAIALAVGLPIFATSMLTFARQHEKELRVASQKHAEMEIVQWVYQSEPDFRLRSYPSSTVLAEQAKTGNNLARIILAWQKLLGAGGTTKDVAGAASLLEQSTADLKQAPLWKTAKAVLVLNQDSMPSDIHAAAQELDRRAGSGLIEARFWQARIFLTERSPLHDRQLGIRALTQAADGGHSHAALLLGTMLASGDVVGRDLVAARRYLQRAATKLPEAQEALQKL